MFVLFLGIGKILVVSKSKIEIIDLFNAKNKQEFINQSLRESSGLFGTYFQNQFLGFLQNKRLVLGNPNKKFEMLQDRTCGSCILLDSNKLWMTGGCYNETATTEIISYNQNSDTMMTSISGPTLPFLIDCHSMIKKNSKTILIIGGIVGFTESSKTWIVDTSNLSELKPGPSLNIPRSGASCAKMQLNSGKIFIVVFGGKSTDTVELLDISTPNQGWTMGKIKLFSCFLMTAYN